jgi:hypothetical protein
VGCPIFSTKPADHAPNNISFKGKINSRLRTPRAKENPTCGPGRFQGCLSGVSAGLKSVLAWRNEEPIANDKASLATIAVPLARTNCQNEQTAPCR